MYVTYRHLRKMTSLTKVDSLIKDTEDSIKDEVSSIYKSNKILVNKIKILNSQYTLKHTPMLMKYVKSLRCEYSQYSDITDNEFNKDICGNLLQRGFELICARFLKEKCNFLLDVRNDKSSDQSLPDWEFLYNTNKYILEATSINAFPIDKFIDVLPIFDKCIKISTELNQVKIRNNNIKWWMRLSDTPRGSQVEKELAIQLRSESNITRERFVEWFNICRFILNIQKNMLPNEMICDLEKVGMPTNSFNWNDIDTSNFYKFLADRIINTLKDKYKKTYIKNTAKKIIIAISIVPLQTHIKRIGIEEFSTEFTPCLQKSLTQEFKENCEVFTNLSGILLDCYYCNWLNQRPYNENQCQDELFLYYSFEEDNLFESFIEKCFYFNLYS